MEMNSQPSEKRMGVIVSWSVSLVLLLVLAVIGYKFRDTAMRLEDVIGNIAKQNQILSQMKANLLISVEAEKNAVLSESDEDSKTFADQSLQAIAEVEQGRRELGELIKRSKDSEEMKQLQEFDQCWTEFQKIEQVLLNLAVQNTNLKAAKLAQTAASDAVQRFENDLLGLLETGTSSGDCKQIAMPVFEAAASCLRIHYLLTPHINSASDQEMDRIEAEMNNNSDVVDQSLDTLAQHAGEKGLTPLQDARKAFVDFIKVTEEVVRLSRQNTNIKSMELSLGKKRMVTAECEGMLNSLQETVQSRTFKATR
jgi:hypothetical protein